MIAIIKTGGKQYLVKKGDTVRVEKLTAQEGEKVTFDAVLLLTDEKGKKLQVGKPTLKAQVEGTVKQQGRARKVSVVKYKPKTRYKKTHGHRQHFTEVEITNIA